MEVILFVIIVIIAYNVYRFYIAGPDEGVERRKDNEKYSFKKMNERINKKD